MARAKAKAKKTVKANKPKTHSGAKKRFTTTATGKVRCKKANSNHQLTHESRKVKQHRNKTVTLAKADQQNIKELLGE